MTATSDETSPLLGRNTNHQSYNGNGPESDLSNVEQQDVEEPKKLSSYFIYVIPMAIGIFLTALDGTIVVSSYAAIGSDLKELQKTSWIATSYLLTLTSFQHAALRKAQRYFWQKKLSLIRLRNFCDRLHVVRRCQKYERVDCQSCFPRDWWGRDANTCIINIVWSCGTSAGASLGGYLSDTIGWRWVFYIQFPLAVISALSVYLFLSLPLPPTASSPDSDFKSKLRRIDFMGAATLVLAVFFLLLGFDRGGDIGWNNKLTVSLLVGFAIFAIGFGLVESYYAAEPLAPTRITINRSLCASYGVNFFGIAGAFAQLFHISLYLQAVLGKTASETGAWLVIAVVSALIGSLSGGLIMQSTGKYYVLTCLAYVVLLMGTIFVLTGTGFMGLPRSTVQVIAGLALTALGNGSGITTSLISLIANAGQVDQAIATAVSYLFRSLGSVIGLSIGSTLVQTTLRSVLHRTLHGENVEEIVQRVRESLDYLKELDPDTQLIVRSAYGDAIDNVLIFSVSMAVAAMISSWFIIEKPLTR
ncbi:hypothetical protein D9756_009495 [Leucocoprinus leucothites]|uniref:Major facilitator superfamily (MFS) profile domain-containing protein n=1 Tax=Leucocoprinus leucothites TaxID=201217 RepID=A0A8H5FTH8_9AGAR|nr:hypothetical protein D9756_009495 [Leucoagaricus leucothites]